MGVECSKQPVEETVAPTPPPNPEVSPSVVPIAPLRHEARRVDDAPRKRLPKRATGNKRHTEFVSVVNQSFNSVASRESLETSQLRLMRSDTADALAACSGTVSPAKVAPRPTALAQRELHTSQDILEWSHTIC